MSMLDAYALLMPAADCSREGIGYTTLIRTLRQPASCDERRSE